MQISGYNYSTPVRSNNSLPVRSSAVETANPEDLVDIGNSSAHQGDYDYMGKVLGGAVYGAIGAGIGGTIGGIAGGAMWGVGGGIGLAAVGILTGGAIGAHLGSR